MINCLNYLIPPELEPQLPLTYFSGQSAEEILIPIYYTSDVEEEDSVPEICMNIQESLSDDEQPEFSITGFNLQDVDDSQLSPNVI